MTSTFTDDFRARAEEVRTYFIWLKKSCEPDDGTPPLPSTSQCFLKATGFLVLYNLVESTMDRAVKEVSTAISASGVGIAKVRSEIARNYIVRTINGRDVFPEPEAFDRVHRLIEHAISGASIDVKVNADGNYCADEIRSTLAKLGVGLDISHFIKEATRGGVDLELIKMNRNSLGHGSLSFVECGGRYTMKDMNRYSLNTLWFMCAVVRRIEKYIYRREYLKGAPS